MATDLKLSRRIRTTRGEIAWDCVGEGPPVVLVHGTPSRAHVWRKVAPRLAEDHTVYVFDLLGFGGSERHVEQDVSLVAHGEVLAELVGRWGLDRPALIGHDIGGAIVLRTHLVEGVAVSRLALVDAVVLAPWITDRTRAMQRDAERLRRAMPDGAFAQAIEEHLRTATSSRLDDELFDSLFGQWRGERGQALYLRNLTQLDEEHTREFEPRLESLDVPVLVVWGERDMWLPIAVSEGIVTAIPDARRVVLPGAGHFSMEDAPGELSDVLADFLG